MKWYDLKEHTYSAYKAYKFCAIQLYLAIHKQYEQEKNYNKQSYRVSETEFLISAS